MYPDMIHRIWSSSLHRRLSHLIFNLKSTEVFILRTQGITKIRSFSHQPILGNIESDKKQGDQSEVQNKIIRHIGHFRFCNKAALLMVCFCFHFLWWLHTGLSAKLHYPDCSSHQVIILVGHLRLFWDSLQDGQTHRLNMPGVNIISCFHHLCNWHFDVHLKNLLISILILMIKVWPELRIYDVTRK